MTCAHESAHFDRTLCACGAMHEYCDDCGEALDCPLNRTGGSVSASAELRKLLAEANGPWPNGTWTPALEAKRASRRDARTKLDAWFANNEDALADLIDAAEELRTFYADQESPDLADIAMRTLGGDLLNALSRLDAA